MDSFGAELVDTFRLSHEQDFEFLSFRVVVDEFGQLFVYVILFDWDVDSDSGTKVIDMVSEESVLLFRILKLSQKFKTRLVRSVDFLFQLQNVFRGIIKILLVFII